MMDRCERQYPMTVVVLSSAKIFQLIGLICWQYTMEGRQPPLRSAPYAVVTCEIKLLLPNVVA